MGKEGSHLYTTLNGDCPCAPCAVAFIANSAYANISSNYPINELQYITKSTQLICEISLTIHQSTDNMKKTNQFWYLTCPLR